MKCLIRMSLALRYLVSDQTGPEPPLLSSHGEKEEVGHQVMEDPAPSRQEEAVQKMNQLEDSVKDLEAMIGSLPDVKGGESTGSVAKKKTLNKSQSVHNVGSRPSSSTLPNTSLPALTTSNTTGQEKGPSLKLTLKYNKITSVLSLIVHRGRESIRFYTQFGDLNYCSSQ